MLMDYAIKEIMIKIWKRHGDMIEKRIKSARARNYNYAIKEPAY